MIETLTPETRTAACRGTRPQARRVRAHRRDPRPRAERDRALHVLAHVVGALQLQALAQGAAHVPDRRRARPAGSRRERRRHLGGRRLGGRVQDGVAQPSRAPSSPTRARRPAWAASSATSSRWARARSPRWTRCASARSTSRASATCSRARSPASAATATASACPPWAARSTSRRPTRATASSTRWPSGSCARRT